MNRNEGRNVKLKMDSINSNNNSNLRRSVRLNLVNYQSLNTFGIKTAQNHQQHWQNSMEMILDQHSSEDLTPFVALVLHGLQRDSKLSYHNALKLCCDIFDFDMNALDSHMDFFYQDGMHITCIFC